MTDCELKHFLKETLEKLENNTLTIFEKNALNDFYLELSVKDKNYDFLSNREFMKLFYTTYFIFNNNKNDRNE